MKSRCLEYKKCQSEMFCFLRKGLSIFESIVSYSRQLIAPQKMYNSAKNAQNPQISCYLRILAFWAEFYIFYGAVERHEFERMLYTTLKPFQKSRNTLFSHFSYCRTPWFEKITTPKIRIFSIFSRFFRSSKKKKRFYENRWNGRNLFFFQCALFLRKMPKNH